jgi:large subunit ribosomal protein L23
VPRCVAAPLQLDIKAVLTRVYGLNVEKVRTLNVEGKKKRTKYGFYRKPDWKKAYVTLKPPEA